MTVLVCFLCPSALKTLHVWAQECSEVWFFLLNVPVTVCRIPLVAGGARNQTSEQSGGRHRMCHTVCQLHSPQQLRTLCTEHKPGYLHAATQWAHSATATPLQLIHANVTTNVNGTCLCNLCVRFLHFESLSAKSVTVKINIYIYIPKKDPENCIFVMECLGDWSLKFEEHFVADLNRCLFSFKYKKRCCYRQECKPSCRLLYLRASAFYRASSCFEVHFNGTRNRCNFDVR